MNKISLNPALFISIILCFSMFTVMAYAIDPLRMASIPAQTAKVGVPFSYTATVSGGTVPYTFFVYANPDLLPGGVTIDTATSLISGTPITAGTYTIGVAVEDSAHNMDSRNMGLTVDKGDQTITVTTHAPANAAYGASFDVDATATSGLIVAITTSGSCSGSGSGSATITMTSGTGTCTVNYNQAGDANYNAAPEVTDSTTAQKADQTITFGALADKTYGDADFDVSATSDSGLTVSFAVGVLDQCTIIGTTVTITGAGSCTVTASQAGNSNYNAATDVPQSFNINQATLTVTGITASNKVYDGTTAATLDNTAAVLVGVIVPDVVTLDTSAAAGAFADSAVGAGKTVTVSGLTIGGADAGNYLLTQPTTTADITAVPAPPAPAPVSTVGGGCIYKWTCGNWSECQSGGTQTRECTLKNTCGSGYVSSETPPATTQSCTYTLTTTPAPTPTPTPPTEETTPTPPTAPAITGAITAGDAALYGGVVVIIIIIIGAVYLKFFRKKK